MLLAWMCRRVRSKSSGFRWPNATAPKSEIRSVHNASYNNFCRASVSPTTWNSMDIEDGDRFGASRPPAAVMLARFCGRFPAWIIGLAPVADSLYIQDTSEISMVHQIAASLDLSKDALIFAAKRHDSLDDVVVFGGCPMVLRIARKVSNFGGWFSFGIEREPPRLIPSQEGPSRKHPMEGCFRMETSVVSG
jgi:hypothetical protein